MSVRHRHWPCAWVRRLSGVPGGVGPRRRKRLEGLALALVLQKLLFFKPVQLKRDDTGAAGQEQCTRICPPPSNIAAHPPMGDAHTATVH